MSELDPAKIRGIVEAILMTADTPVSPGKFLGILKELNGRQLRETIDALQAEYDESGHACTIAEVAGGFQLATRKEYGPWLRKFHERGRVRLSQAGLETLAIVAFKQPITRVELESIRGVNSGGVLNTLMEHDLVRIVGRSDGIGKPHLFGTTKEFLIHFGLKSLSELPKPRELTELLAAGERKADRLSGANQEEAAEQAELDIEEGAAETAGAGEELANGNGAAAVDESDSAAMALVEQRDDQGDDGAVEAVELAADQGVDAQMSRDNGAPEEQSGLAAGEGSEEAVPEAGEDGESSVRDHGEQG